MWGWGWGAGGGGGGGGKQRGLRSGWKQGYGGSRGLAEAGGGLEHSARVRVPSSRGRPAESARAMASLRRSTIRSGEGDPAEAAPVAGATGQIEGLHSRSRPSLPPESSQPSDGSTSRQKIGPSCARKRAQSAVPDQHQTSPREVPPTSRPLCKKAQQRNVVPRFFFSAPLPPRFPAPLLSLRGKEDSPALEGSSWALRPLRPLPSASTAQSLTQRTPTVASIDSTGDHASAKSGSP